MRKRILIVALLFAVTLITVLSQNNAAGKSTNYCDKWYDTIRNGNNVSYTLQSQGCIKVKGKWTPANERCAAFAYSLAVKGFRGTTLTTAVKQQRCMLNSNGTYTAIRRR